ncbi:MAG: fumarylacetoacetate hydrolase family protein [candidate division NC10 bacterium]|nr:fumarylacetoacetate hydrolase family protein [candidate division NC10 bacterium]
MKIVRFAVGKEAKYGIVEEDLVREIQGDIFGQFKVTRKTHPLKRIKYLTPTELTKIVAVGLNYRDHAEEAKMPVPDEPVIFIKPASAALPHNGKIIYPKECQRLDYEAEFAIVMKREARYVPREKALRYVLGYTCLNDVTARDLQAKDGQWTRSKSFYTFAPFGPWIETTLDLSNAPIRGYLNGELKQNSNIKNFIFDVPSLISFISRVMPLLPGDVITTGTPSGIGPMQVGDVIEVEVGGIGRLRNTVIAQK